MSASTSAAELLLAVEAVRPWERANVVKAYAASEANDGFPVNALKPLLTLVTISNRGRTMVDIIPAVLRSSRDPFAACCEMEAFIEVRNKAK